MIETNLPLSLPTIIIGLSIFALLLTCVYVFTFVVTPWPQRVENNAVLEIHRDSEQVLNNWNNYVYVYYLLWFSSWFKIFIWFQAFLVVLLYWVLNSLRLSTKNKQFIGINFLGTKVYLVVTTLYMCTCSNTCLWIVKRDVLFNLKLAFNLNLF